MMIIGLCSVEVTMIIIASMTHLANIGKVSHQSHSIIMRKGLKSHGHHSDIGLCSVEVTMIIIASMTTDIRVFIFCDHSKERGVCVGKWLNGTHTPSSASTLERVRGAAY